MYFVSADMAQYVIFTSYNIIATYLQVTFMFVLLIWNQKLFSFISFKLGNLTKLELLWNYFVTANFPFTKEEGEKKELNFREEGEISSKSREEGEIGSESREKGDLPPCSTPLTKLAL